MLLRQSDPFVSRPRNIAMMLSTAKQVILRGDLVEAATKRTDHQAGHQRPEAGHHAGAPRW